MYGIILLLAVSLSYLVWECYDAAFNLSLRRGTPKKFVRQRASGTTKDKRGCPVSPHIAHYLSKLFLVLT